MKATRIFFIGCIVFFIFSLLIYPERMLAASVNSLNLWFQQVLPSLFPFMVATGILIRMGVAHSLGRVLQPVMKPVFGLSGVCAFPFLLGFISGYPMGAKITVMLYKDNAISLEDAQGVLAFSNNPGPLFVIGTAGTALLQSPVLGYLMMLSIFFSAITTGFLFRFQKRPENIAPVSLHKKNTDTLGTLLGKSIADAIETILQIGGFIILFGVFIEALQVSGVSHLLFLAISSILPISQGIFDGLFGGFLEMTNGVSLLSQTGQTTAFLVACCSTILSFGGLSILGQTLGILAAIPIRTSKYIAAKAVNAILAGFYTYLLYPLFEDYLTAAISVFHPFRDSAVILAAYPLPYWFFFILVLLWATTAQKRHT